MMVSRPCQLRQLPPPVIRQVSSGGILLVVGRSFKSTPATLSLTRSLACICFSLLTPYPYSSLAGHCCVVLELQLRFSGCGALTHNSVEGINLHIYVVAMAAASFSQAGGWLVESDIGWQMRQQPGE